MSNIRILPLLGSGGGGTLPSYGASIEMTMNSDYVLSLTLKDQNGSALGTTQTVDLPLETMVVSGSYDNTNKKIILTLNNGQTVDVPVGDLVSGLQSKITSSNKLSADLIEDGTDNKVYTATEQTKLAGIAEGAEVNVNADWDADSGDAQILNKPTIPAAQVNSDWNAASGVAQILNKPSTVAMVVTFTDQTTATYNIYHS